MHSYNFFQITFWCLSAWSFERQNESIERKKSVEARLHKLKEDYINFRGGSWGPSEWELVRQKKRSQIEKLSSMMSQLTIFSLFLKKWPKKQQTNLTRILIKQINNGFLLQRIARQRRPEQGEGELPWDEGCLLPVDLLRPGKQVMVVSILKNEIQYFRTKTRAPFKIVFECVE